MGACRQFPAVSFQKRWKPLKAITFSGVTLFKKTPAKCFDHRFDHLRKNRKNWIFYTFRGVAKLVSHRIWEHAGGFRFLIFQMHENPCKYWLFRVLPFSKKHRQNVLTTDLTTYGKWPKNRIFFTLRGVAKLVSHRIWDAGIARSSRVTPTIWLWKAIFRAFFFVFSILNFEGWPFASVSPRSTSSRQIDIWWFT